MNRAEQLRHGRKQAGFTQVEAAGRLGVSQPYLSLLENGKRAFTARLARAAARLYALPPTVLAVPSELARGRLDSGKVVRELAALGYPGFAHVRRPTLANPAAVVLDVVSRNDVDARLTQALPWVLARFPDLDWKELVSRVKLRDAQNRLGFVVTLAKELAERTSDASAVEQLRNVEHELERSRLVAETTLGRDSMPESERSWLRANRPPAARHWNVLTTLTSDQISSAGSP